MTTLILEVKCVITREGGSSALGGLSMCIAVPISCDRARTSTKEVRAKMGGVLQSGGAYTLVTTLVKSTAASWPNSGHSADVGSDE